MDGTDDVVVAFLRQSGTGRGSGVPVNLIHGGVFDLKDGRIARISLYLDPADALKAAGLSE